MKNFYIILLIMLVLIGTANAQKHFNNWYFGEHAGITFNTPTGEPIALNDGKIQRHLEGCSSISDNSGQLLFYTDGVTVWNKQHKIMSNGIGLYGDWSSSQSAIIVPKPATENIYYIFTADADYYSGDSSVGINYSIIDISLDNGKGEVIEKNIPLLRTRSEKLTAVIHQNKEDIWVVSQDTKNRNFSAFLVTKNGVDHNPVKSPCTLYLKNWQIGTMKFSSNTKKLAVTHVDVKSCLHLYDFNNFTGAISNETIFTFPDSGSYSVEFSKNNKYLYFTLNTILWNTKLVQMDISSNDSAIIFSSIYNIIDDEDYFTGTLQIGPNNRIYMKGINNSLSVINKPDLKCPDCDFQLNGVNLGNGSAMMGLPSVVQGYFGSVILCEGDLLTLNSKNHYEGNVEWTGPNGFFSTENNIIIEDTKPEMSGTYYYKISKDSKIIENDSVLVTINSREKILFENNSELIVKANSIKLKVVENPEKTKFKWYGINSDENEVVITKSGSYSVVAENESGCKDSVTIKIKLYPGYCIGNDIILDSYHTEPEDSVYNTEYLWSGPNGFTSSEKNPVLENVNESFSGDYEVRIITKFGTGDFEGESDTIFTKVPVLVYGDLGLEISAGKIRICDSDSTDIYPINTYSEYLWSTGETTESITVHDAGVYKLIVKNEFGCSDSAEIEIFKYDAEIELNKGILIYEGPLCVGDSQIVRLQMTIKTSTDLTISSITTKSNSFEIVNYSSHIRTFKNGEVVNLEIIFKPQDAGIYDDELVFHSTEPCEFVKSVPISASAKQVIELSFGEHYSVAGQILEIPILGEIICPEPQNLTTEYEIEVSFDKEYFSPDDVKFGDIISNAIVGNERIIKIKADGDFSQTKSEINVIFGRALLGRSETSQIKIEDAKLTKDRYFAGFTGGSLNVDGCVNDLSGLQMFKQTSMKVAPNPADGDLKVSVGTQEEGSFSLVIYDFQGREVAKSEFKRSNRIYEEKDYTFNISGLGTGVYSVHLTAPWTLKREQLVIVK